MEEPSRTTFPTLQSLPTEIRLKIYEEMSPPHDSHLADWRGLFISCKLFHHEMKHELLRNTIKYFDQIKRDWTKLHPGPLLLSTPSNTRELKSLSVAIPNSYFRAREAQFPATRTFPSTLSSLLQIGISQIVLKIYEDDEAMQRTTAAITEHSLADFMRDLLGLMDPSKSSRCIKLDDGTDYVFSRVGAIDEIIFEWGTLDMASGDEDLILPYYAREHPSDWTVEFMREHICGPATGAVWKRREYTCYISLPLAEDYEHLSKGLMLSCKKINAEMENEIPKQMNRYLAEMKKEWNDAYGSELRTSNPQTVLSIKKDITVAIPNSFFRSQRVGLPRALTRLIPLHVDKIKITTYEDQPGHNLFVKFEDLFQFNLSFKDLFVEKLSVYCDDGTTFSNDTRLATDCLVLQTNLWWDRPVRQRPFVQDSCTTPSGAGLDRSFGDWQAEKLPGVGGAITGISWRNMQKYKSFVRDMGRHYYY
ncbi:hypothetical protein BU23DRAFT_571321 [Bimuria novae-zelandiae CBS 107.79]|uniref:Uncharacterized protein n=1 Tax=Bimuria novae-zelandiae CBS 107.79 TaxID=1447943 RepID=A0A6A5V912_9PLEO|nr:hypothetical protein BU23DRAFT_571321 [Bimuria novae-zelandiae CBS 107.79]